MGLKKFKLIDNSKRPTNEWAKENKNKYFRTSHISGNSGVVCGKINNITVVDLDFYKESDDNKFIKKFGDYISAFDTYTVKTYRGGIHLYFQYESDIKTTTNTQYNIDIRNDNSYVVSAGSMIEGKKYIIINDVPIKKMSNDIKNWIINNLYTIKKKNTNKKTNMTINDNKIINEYNITRRDLLNIINNLSLDYWTNNELFLKYTTFCKYFKIEKEWDELNKTKPNYNKNNNYNTYWNTAKPTEYIIDSIIGDVSLPYYKYKPHPYKDIKYNKDTTTINQNKLGYDFIKNNDINYLIKSDTGTGKTTTFKHYIKNTNQKFISICSRVSLVNEQYKVFNEHGVDCVNYKFRLEENNLFKKFDNQDNIVITVDSIIYLSNIDFSKYIIYLDEYNSLLEYLITSPTLQNTRAVVFYRLKQILKNAKQIIATDADINDISYKFFDSNITNYNMTINTYKHNNNINATEIKTVEDLIRRLKKENKFMLCMDSKTQAEAIYHILDNQDIKLYVSGNNEDISLDDYDKVIFSPKVLYGIDSSMSRNIYCMYKEHTISPTAYLQQIGRCRNIKTLYYLFSKKNFIHDDKTYEDIQNETYEKNILGCRYFSDSCLGNKELNDEYMLLLNKYLYLYNCYNVNKFGWFRLLLKDRGFKIIKDVKVIKPSLKEFNKVIKDVKNEKGLNVELDKILKVPEEHKNEYKEYYTNQYLLEQHFNLCNMINYTQEELKDIISKKNDYNICKITNNKSKLIYLKKLKAIIQDDTTLYNIDALKDICHEERKRLYQEYIIIYGSSNISDFKDNTNILKAIRRMYTINFGKNIFNEPTIKKKTLPTGKRTNVRYYTINHAYVQKNINLYNYRNDAA